jgi:FkbM family methyltransferase
VGIDGLCGHDYPAWRGGKAAAKIFTHFTEARRRGRIHRARAVKLDDLVEDLRVSMVDLIKIDARGAELEILRGSLDIISLILLESIGLL